MNRFLIVLLPLLAIALSGCAEQPETIQTPWSDGEDGDSPNGSGLSRRLARINVVRLEVPVGQASASEEIWSYLAEEPIGADRLVCLGRNGMRVGLGRRDTWPDVARVLRRITGRELAHRILVGPPGAPQHITLKYERPVQTIFSFHADRTLSGADYPAGDNVLTVSCTVDRDDRTRVLLTGMPQVRSVRKKMRYVKGPAGVRMLNKPVMSPFRDMLFQVPMREKEFLVIGPGAAARRPHSVGRHFFVQKKEGMEFETVLVVTPEPLTVPVK